MSEDFKPKWKTVAGGVSEAKMPWGGTLTIWEGPAGIAYTVEFKSGWHSVSYGFAAKSRADIVQMCLEENATDYAHHGFPEKTERERLERVQKWEDERRAKDNYEAALALLARCSLHSSPNDEIQAFLNYDAALRKLATAKVESERARHGGNA